MYKKVIFTIIFLKKILILITLKTYLLLKNTLIKKCLKLDTNFQKLYVVGFSINEKDNLSFQLKKNIFLTIVDIIHYIMICAFVFNMFIICIKNKIY